LDWIKPAQDTNKLRPVLNTVMNHPVLQMWRNSCLGMELPAYQEEL